MILIADSGSTKTDWCLVEDARVLQRVPSQGINPFHQEMDVIRGIVEKELLPLLGGVAPNGVFFYGSGCREEMVPEMENVLRSAFPGCGNIEVHGDLLAAARAVCGKEEGIACILGTGSNSCLYDGCKIIANTPPLGYILGDEGSGAVLGRLFLNAVFKRQLPDIVCEAFLKESRLTLPDIIKRVYREPMANRFLASLSIYIRPLTYYPEVHRFVVDCFRQFFLHNVRQYERHDLKVGAVGSVAYHYAPFLREAATKEGFEMGEIMRSPMEGLLRFHS